jgi:hypothetical protein
VATPDVAGARANLLEEPIPRARPRATAYFLGALLVAIMSGAIAVLLIIPSKKLVIRPPNNSPPFVVGHVGIWLGVIGLSAGLIGITSLVFGNTRRLRLIYEFTASAAELAATLAQTLAEQRGRIDTETGSDYREQEDSRRLQSVNDLKRYEKALLQLGAYENAMQVSGWIVQNGGRPSHGLRNSSVDY